MSDPNHPRTPEEKVVPVGSGRASTTPQGEARPKVNEGVARYLAAVLAKLDTIEYGDPSEFILARTGRKPRRSTLSEVWVPPTLKTQEEKNIERDVRALLSISEQCAVVLAHPGSGKSTLARYLTCKFAKEFQAGQFNRFAVFVPLTMLQIKGRTYQRAVIDCALRAFDINLEEAAIRQLEESLKGATIIFDGLDELPLSKTADDLVPTRIEAAALIRNVNIPHSEGFRTGSLSSIVTCRINEYFEDLRTRIRPSVLFEISNFSPEQAKEAVTRWHRAAQTLAAEEEIDAGNLLQRGADIIAILASNSDLGAVCLTPLMLNILQTVYSDEGGDLPSSVSQLCEQAVTRLLVKKHTLGDLKTFVEEHAEWILNAISQAAFLLQQRVISGAPRILSEDDLRSVARESCPITDRDDYEYRESLIMRVAAHLRRGHGILQQQRKGATGEGQYDFAHNVFREVLAGRALAKLRVTEKRPFAFDERWHGPIRYWAGIRAASEDGRHEINAFVGELWGDAAGQTIEAILARAEILSEVCAVAQGNALTFDLRQRIAASQQELMKALERRELTFARRLRIGDLLGIMGDPRLSRAPVERLHWIEAGQKRLGRNEVHATRIPKYRNVPAAPPIEGVLSRFALGQFLVTNAEYKQFLNAGGYRVKKYWQSAEGWAWASGEEATLTKLSELARTAAPTHLSSEILAARLVPEDFPDQCERMIHRSVPMYWADPNHNRPNQPVVGINWWEALAYCSWLDDFLHQYNQLSPALRVRLPTEAEWESAAWHCSAGNCYPWSSGTPSENAHLRATERPESDLKALRSCGVGLFVFLGPESPLYDLVGNVWEWTGSLAKPYSADSFSQVIEVAELQDRIARGSSWLSSEVESAEITFRSFDPPYNAYEDLGFRICIAEQST